MEDQYVFTGHGECLKCGKNILWFRTTAGRSMPVDDSRDLTEKFLDRGDTLDGDTCRAFCHFETCEGTENQR